MHLEGDRIYLRPLTWEDTELIVRWRSDPTIASQLFSERAPSRLEHEAWFGELLHGDRRIEFVIVVRESEQPVGTAGLSRIDREQRQAEYGILIGEPEWRSRGISFEASELLLHHAFEKLELETVTLESFADNPPARSLYARLGFVEDTQGRGRRLKDGRWRETLSMRLTRVEWRQHVASMRR